MMITPYLAFFINRTHATTGCGGREVGGKQGDGFSTAGSWKEDEAFRVLGRDAKPGHGLDATGEVLRDGELSRAVMVEAI